jgi:threonine dehydratase
MTAETVPSFPALPSLPALGDITTAARRLAPVINRTPLEFSPWLSDLAGVPIYLKLECWQRTRSFKLRGAYNAIASLSPEVRGTGLVTASAGNHGQAVALAASLLGTRSTVFVPADAPAVKKDRIRSYGATLNDEAATYDDAERDAIAHARATHQYFVHAFSDPIVVAGQGTIALEILEDLPGVRSIITPVGGGGLATGIGAALRTLAPTVALYGVQSDETRAMYDAFIAGRIVDSPIIPTIADGLAGCTDETAFRWLRSLIEKIHLVPESALTGVVRKLFDLSGVVAEGASAVGAAAVIEGVVRPEGPAVIVISGGNIDATRLAAILNA